MKSLVWILLILSTPAFADDFENLIGLLRKGTCGDIQYWVSATKDPNVFDLSLLRPPETAPLGMFLTSPTKSNMTMIHVDPSKSEIVYSESDMVGWVNLKVSFAAAAVTGIDLYKTLPGFDKSGVPNGFRYSEGPKCGIFL